ncbi:hypothetical protein PV04_07274 [Phialophora macrospora]|uniref:HIT-type domain-containing protein n=1 Tax=Phialophora macrospora TaxID=1851006 RepID=A0A0D2FDT8_9EURO|nr:hypothetical protein PV04_07274 [Phialophora macrospora]
MQVCSVCANQTSKYRCPSCRASSCSLPCFQTHKSGCTHPASKTIANPTSPPRPSPASVEDVPFSDSLIHDPRLQKLFDQYPNLRVKLKYIFDTATGNGHGDEPSNPNARGQRYQNPPNKRITHAMRILASQLNSENADGSGVKAFAEFVAELNPNRSGGDTGHENFLP